MTKVGDDAVVSADKFNTYSRQGLKSTTQTDRQSMMGNFISAMDNHFSAVDRIYQAAGVENPFPAVGMGMLKESLERPSVGTRLGDLWHEKLGPSSIGNTAGATIGGLAGEALGHGLGGAYLGKELLGPVFSGMIKPLMEKYPNVDLGAFKQAIALGKSIEKGDNNLINASKSLFGGGTKTFPSHVIPDAADLEKLDDRTKSANNQSIMNTTGRVGYYMPGHETAIAKTSGDAVAYLNSQRPQATKALPLDNEPKISQAQKSQFQRTLSIAQQPLMALKYLKEGTLVPQDVATIKTLYPDYYQKMTEKMLSELTNHLSDGGTVPYKIKQGMSLFLGSPLDSTMTPFSIQSTQSVFAGQAMAKAAAAQAKPRKMPSKISDNYQTANEGAIKRRAAG